MRRPLRFAVLFLALTVALPGTLATPARAGTEPIRTDIKVPKAVVDWLKRNGPTLYIIFDELMDDLFCGCPPPPPLPEEEPPPYVP